MNIPSITQPLHSSSFQTAATKHDVSTSVKQAEIAKGPAATQADTPEKAINATDKSQASTREQVEEAVSRIREFVQPVNNNIKFLIDDEVEGTLVKVIDANSEEVIRQIPSEEAIRIAKSLDQLKGLLLYNAA